MEMLPAIQIFPSQQKHERLLANNLSKGIPALFLCTWSNLWHLEHSGIKKKKILLMYFQQSCTVQSYSYSQSPRLNPLTGEGVCLRIALTAGAQFSVLVMPFKDELADLHSGFLFKDELPTTASEHWEHVFVCCLSRSWVVLKHPSMSNLPQNPLRKKMTVET